MLPTVEALISRIGRLRTAREPVRGGEKRLASCGCGSSYCSSAWAAGGCDAATCRARVLGVGSAHEGLGGIGNERHGWFVDFEDLVGGCSSSSQVHPTGNDGSERVDEVRIKECRHQVGIRQLAGLSLPFQSWSVIGFTSLCVREERTGSWDGSPDRLHDACCMPSLTT